MSTPINDGGPAFPRQHHAHPLHGGSVEGHPGMTLRDYFAAKALQGLTADGTTGGTFAEYASDAYRYADAMLAAREKRT